jgi:hypothetical protein
MRELSLIVLVMGLSACGGNVEPSPTEPRSKRNADDTIGFTASQISATRFPVTCGVMNPPFEDGDTYAMNAVGAGAVSPSNVLSITFLLPMRPGPPISLVVHPFSPGSGTLMLGGGTTTVYGSQFAISGELRLDSSQGANPSEIDTGAFDSVTITLLEIPMQNGAPLTVRLQMHFVDGKVFDETFSSPLSSLSTTCAAG